MSTFLVENEYQDTTESINSIMVIGSSQHESEFGLSTDVSHIEETHKENDFNRLQKKFNDLKMKYDECFKDNVLLKSQCDFLNSKLENLKKATKSDDNLSDYDFDNFENNDSILAYVDVENICISEKIEKTCKETNQTFTSIDSMFDSMKFFVKNIWSLIAHKYSETELEDSQIIRNELIEKLTESKEGFQRQQRAIQELNDELESHTVKSELMKDKLLIQNEQIKELVNQVKNNFTNSSIERITDTESVTSLSINKSPSILTRFKNMVKSSDKEIKSLLDSTDKEMYMFTTNEDFLAIDKTLENSQNTLLRSQEQDELSEAMSQKPLTSNLNNVSDYSIFECVNCKTSAKINKLSNTTIHKHRSKECSEKLVCMFCMKLFQSPEQLEFEKHVQKHVNADELCFF